MKTFILTLLAIILTPSISSADLLDTIFSTTLATEVTDTIKKEVNHTSSYNIRYGIAVNFEEALPKFLKTTDFVFFKKWKETKPGTKCCAIWNGKEVYSLCISGIFLVAGKISD